MDYRGTTPGATIPDHRVHWLRLAGRPLDIEVGCLGSRGQTGGSDRPLVALGNVVKGEAGKSRWCCYPLEKVSQPDDVIIARRVGAPIYKIDFHTPTLICYFASWDWNPEATERTPRTKNHPRCFASRERIPEARGKTPRTKNPLTHRPASALMVGQTLL
ncbi:hypothetical protein ElyMa_004854000 [Elysia marginata]|uniref:Uncharacterized protein n=1 Tax=Elysia marginata TaxID=1093978 RepID=A0AAV4IT66_9GAST|nr:hypothetical protein ElyMa_004854000 [Elysia marginata]